MCRWYFDRFVPKNTYLELYRKKSQLKLFKHQIHSSQSIPVLLGLVRFIAIRLIVSRFIAKLIHRRVDSLRVDSSHGRLILGRFIAGLIHRRVMSPENIIETWNFLSGHTKLGSFCCKDFFVATRLHWKASFTRVYLIEMYKFSFEHENWVHLDIKSFLCPAKKFHVSIKFSVEITLRWIDPRWIDPAMNRPAMHNDAMSRTWPQFYYIIIY
jgi:hypothetical protein